MGIIFAAACRAVPIACTYMSRHERKLKRKSYLYVEHRLQKYRYDCLSFDPLLPFDEAGRLTYGERYRAHRYNGDKSKRP